MKLSLSLFLVSLSSFSLEVGHLFFKDFLGHVHKAPSSESSSMTTVQCGHKVKIMGEIKTDDEHWLKVIVGEDKGFVLKSRLVPSRPSCFQSQYNVFYNSLDFDVTDLYYYGKLEEAFQFAESKAK